MANSGVGFDARIATATLAHWAKKKSELTLRYQPTLRAMMRKGRVKNNVAGGQLEWVFVYREAPMEPYIDGTQRVFEKQKLTLAADLPFDRGFEAKDMVTILDKMQHRGKAAVVNLLKGKAKVLEQGNMRQLPAQLWADGNINMTGFTKGGWHGIESFMSIDTGAQTATDQLATTPNDTFAGYGTGYTSVSSGSTDLAQGYKAWSPVILSTNRTVSGVTQDWDVYCEDYMSQIIKELTYGETKDQMPDLGVLTKAAYTQAISVLRRKERLVFKRGNALVDTEFGIENSFGFEGVEWIWDVSIPTTDAGGDVVDGYVLNLDQVSLKNMLGSLWESKTQFKVEYVGDPMLVLNLSQLCWESPKFQGKLAKIA